MMLDMLTSSLLFPSVLSADWKMMMISVFVMLIGVKSHLLKTSSKRLMKFLSQYANQLLCRKTFGKDTGF